MSTFQNGTHALVRGPILILESKLVTEGAIVNHCKDYGSLTKVIPVLDIEKDPSTIIIIIDDDMTYQPRVVEGLVQGVREFQCPVGYSGIAYPETVLQIYGRIGFMLYQGHGVQTEILECAFGVAIPRHCFNDFFNIEPMKETSEKCMYTTDDYIFSKFFDMKGICKRVVYYPWAGRRGDDWSTIWVQNQDSQTYSLSRDGNLENYIKVGKLMKL
jgi:hypothetical protein